MPGCCLLLPLLLQRGKVRDDSIEDIHNVPFGAAANAGLLPASPSYVNDIRFEIIPLCAPQSRFHA